MVLSAGISLQCSPCERTTIETLSIHSSSELLALSFEEEAYVLTHSLQRAEEEGGRALDITMSRELSSHAVFY